jgi:hypothetical protein
MLGYFTTSTKHSCPYCVFSALTFGIVRYDRSEDAGSLMPSFLIRKRAPRLRAQPGRMHLAPRVAAKRLANSMRDQASQHWQGERVGAPVGGRLPPATNGQQTGYVVERPSVLITSAGCSGA